MTQFSYKWDKPQIQTATQMQIYKMDEYLMSLKKKKEEKKKKYTGSVYVIFNWLTSWKWVKP